MNPNMSIEDAIRAIEAPELLDDRYIIKSLEEAVWAFERLEEALKKKSHIIEVADALLAEKTRAISNWVSHETEPLDYDIEFFRAKILQYYNKQREQDAKFKLTTPYGKVTKRTTKVWKYDEQKVLEYLKNNKPELIRVKEEIDKAELKKQCPDGINAETGEIVEGIDIEAVTNIEVKVG